MEVDANAEHPYLFRWTDLKLVIAQVILKFVHPNTEIEIDTSDLSLSFFISYMRLK